MLAAKSMSIWSGYSLIQIPISLQSFRYLVSLMWALQTAFLLVSQGICISPLRFFLSDFTSPLWANLTISLSSPESPLYALTLSHSRFFIPITKNPNLCHRSKQKWYFFFQDRECEWMTVFYARCTATSLLYLGWCISFTFKVPT